MKNNKIRSFFGYLAAGLMIPLALVSIMGMGPIAELLVKTSGVEISPWFTGGEVSRTVSHENYQTRIHRPIFDGLFSERREGFVQVVWAPAQNLPETIVEDVDYDNDGSPDFQITLRPREKTADWKIYNHNVGAMQGPYIIGDGVGIRMPLTHP
jgi:hypothetical protein